MTALVVENEGDQVARGRGRCATGEPRVRREHVALFFTVPGQHIDEFAFRHAGTVGCWRPSRAANASLQGRCPCSGSAPHRRWRPRCWNWS